MWETVVFVFPVILLLHTAKSNPCLTECLEIFICASKKSSNLTSELQGEEGDSPLEHIDPESVQTHETMFSELGACGLQWSWTWTLWRKTGRLGSWPTDPLQDSRGWPGSGESRRGCKPQAVTSVWSRCWHSQPYSSLPASNCAFLKLKGCVPLHRLSARSRWAVEASLHDFSVLQVCPGGSCLTDVSKLLFGWFGCSGFGWVVTSYQRCLNMLNHLPGFWNIQLKTKSLVSPALWIAEPKAQASHMPRDKSNLLITSDKRKFPQDRNKLWKYKIVTCCELFRWQHHKDVRTGSWAEVNQGNIIDCGEAVLIYIHWWFDPLSLRSQSSACRWMSGCWWSWGGP